MAVALFALTAARTAAAGTCTWQGDTSGDFNTGANWSCNRVPGSSRFTDTIVFSASTANVACTMSASYSSTRVSSVTFQNSYTKTFSANGFDLTLGNASWTQGTGTFNSGTGNVSIGNGLTVSGGTFSGGGGSISVTGAISVSSGTLSPGNSDLSSTGNMTVSSSGTFTGGGGALSVGGILSVSGGSFTGPTGTSAATVSNGVNVTGGTLTGGGGDINVTGGVTVTGGTLTLQANGSGLSATGNITVSTGTFTGGAGTITTGGNLTASSGTFTASSTSTQIAGNFNNSTTFSSNGGTLVVTGSGAGGTISTGGYTLTGLQINGGGTYTLSGALSVSGTLTVSSGTLVTGSQSVTLGGLTINGGTFNAPTGTLTLTGAFNHTSGTFVANGGTVFFSGTTALSHTFGGATFANVQVGLGTSGMVGYWKLDETTGTTAADSSGNGNAGTYNSSGVTHSTSLPSTLSGDVRSLLLDGSTGYVALGTTNFPANNAPQSMSLWFKGTAVTGTNQNMIALINGGGASANQLGFRDLNLVLWSYGGAALVSTAAPTDGAWHQVIYTYDGVTDSLYLDGVVKATSTTAVHQTGAPASAFLGTYAPNAEMWNGSLDDVRVYSRALTAGEISLLAGGGSPTTIAGTHTFSDAFACTGDFSILAGTVRGSSALSVGGNWLNAATFTSTGTVTMTGTSSTGTITTGGASFGGLTINGSGGTYTLQDNLSVTGNLTITAGTLAGTKTVTVGGNFTNAGTFSDTGTVTLTSGSGAATLTSGTARFSALTLSGSGTYTLQDRLWVPGGTITLSSGTLAAGSKTIHAGALSVGSGTASLSSATLILDGSSNQSLPLSTLGGLRIEDPTEANLVGYWKFDEGGGQTVRDYSGNGNTGTLSGSGVTWSTSSVPAVAYDDYASVTLDGSSGYASVGTTNLPATDGAITISAWVNLTSTAGNQNIVALSSSGGALQFGLRGGAYTAWQSGATSTVTGPAATTGAWHHVAYTYNGSSTDVIYVDGTAYSGSFTHQSGATTSAYLGTFSGLGELLSGGLDDVRIYNTALTASQIKELAAGRYAGTGGVATVSLSAATTVNGLLSIDSGILNANGRTLAAGATGPTTAVVNTGTYNVGTAAQTFSGGLTVNGGGALTLASSGGSVNIASGKTLTIDGTLNASTKLATIQPVSGYFTFKVGSTASATPNVNVSGLSVSGTSDGMQIGASTSSSTTFTELDNVAFSNGIGTQYLLIQGKSVYLSSTGCSFGAGTSVGGTTVAVRIAGNGTADGDTRAMFGGTTCATNWYVSASDTSCASSSKSDDDANNDGVGDNPSTNGAVWQFLRSAATDTAGSIVGLPSAAFDWNTYTYYSTYAAFHNASAGTSDVIYVRDESGNALYSWTVPTAGESITGTPQWTTSGTTHYVYVATTQGHVYRLIDTSTGTTSGSLTLDATGWTTNPFDCSCAITTPLGMDATNLYWGSTTSGKNFWTLGKSTESNPTPVAITPTVTSSGLSVTAISGTTYAFMGVTGDFLKISTAGQSITATNTSPGTHAIKGRVVIGYKNASTIRLYGGDDGGNMWAVDPGSGFATANGLWHYTAASSISGSPYYDLTTDTLQFGTDGGAILSLNAATGAVVNAGYPYTPSAGDAITAAPLYYKGILVIGSSGGKLYFLDRNTGSSVALIKKYDFGSNEAISGVGYDVNVNRFMVTTANPTNKDGRLYYFDLITDPTNGSN